jgi:hypothetical protein
VHSCWIFLPIESASRKEHEVLNFGPVTSQTATATPSRRHTAGKLPVLEVVLSLPRCHEKSPAEHVQGSFSLSYRHVIQTVLGSVEGELT